MTNVGLLSHLKKILQHLHLTLFFLLKNKCTEPYQRQLLLADQYNNLEYLCFANVLTIVHQY